MLNKRTKHLCSTCLHAVWSGSPTCKAEDVEWNDEPIDTESPDHYDAGIIKCREYVAFR